MPPCSHAIRPETTWAAAALARGDASRHADTVVRGAADRERRQIGRQRREWHHPVDMADGVLRQRAAPPGDDAFDRFAVQPGGGGDVGDHRTDQVACRHVAGRRPSRACLSSPQHDEIRWRLGKPAPLARRECRSLGQPAPLGGTRNPDPAAVAPGRRVGERHDADARVVDLRQSVAALGRRSAGAERPDVAGTATMTASASMKSGAATGPISTRNIAAPAAPVPRLPCGGTPAGVWSASRPTSRPTGGTGVPLHGSSAGDPPSGRAGPDLCARGCRDSRRQPTDTAADSREHRNGRSGCCFPHRCRERLAAESPRGTGPRRRRAWWHEATARLPSLGVDAAEERFDEPLRHRGTHAIGDQGPDGDVVDQGQTGNSRLSGDARQFIRVEHVGKVGRHRRHRAPVVAGSGTRAPRFHSPASTVSGCSRSSPSPTVRAKSIASVADRAGIRLLRRRHAGNLGEPKVPTDERALLHDGDTRRVAPGWQTWYAAASPLIPPPITTTWRRRGPSLIRTLCQHSKPCLDRDSDMQPTSTSLRHRSDTRTRLLGGG